MRGILPAAVAGLLLASVPVQAHHAAAAVYDSNKPITFTGKVTKVEWANPHIYYYVDATDKTGKIVNYAIEGGPPNILFRAGWRKDTLKPGDTVTVEGYLAKDGSNHVNGRNVTLPDGKKIFAGSNDGSPLQTGPQ
jgi:uncharacterized protein DUF6152